MSGPLGAEGPGDLVERAQARLQQRGQARQRLAAEEAARAEKAEAGLRGAIAEMRAGGSDARAAALRTAHEAAARAGRAPKLRVEAQLLLDQWHEQARRSQREERLLERLHRQLSEAAGLTAPAPKASAAPSSCGGSLGGSRPPSPGPAGAARAAQKQVDSLLGQLRRAADSAAREGGAEEMVASARQLIQRVERMRRKDEQAASKLSGLLQLQDAEQLGTSMRDVLEKWQPTGERAQIVAAQLEERMAALKLQKQHQDWLRGELDAAAARLDSARLLQLCDQARALQLTVPSEMVALLHELEEGAGAQGQCGAKAAARKSDHLARLREDGQRKARAAALALDMVETSPTMKELRAAQEAVLAVRQARGVGSEEVRAAERRLARVERLHEPRLEAEEEIRALLARAEGPQWHTLLPDGALAERLRTALRKAEKTSVGADHELCQLGHELLQRTTEAEEARRAVEQRLREAAGQRPGGGRPDRDLEALSEAVEEARRLGLDTLAADRELARRRGWQDQAAAAEAELREASKGIGPGGRARLESALQGAKEAGVSAERLRFASVRLEELARHEQRCSLAAGNLKRALPSLEKEPWLLQPLLEAARPLEPWTPELERAAHAARERVEGASALQQRRKDIEQELRAHLRAASTAGGGGGGGGESATTARPGPAQEARVLAGLVERGKAVGADAGLLREVGERLRGLRREGRQLDVAQRRLRLALGQKDLPGIERELRSIRAMGASAPGAEGAAGAPGLVASARGERSGEQPHSDRLVEAAAAMMRHLQDAQVRRHNAQTALCERLSGDAAAAAASDPCAPVKLPAGDVGAAVPSVDSQGWVKEMTEMIHEAKQSGVPPTLIEHARLRVREVRRWESERQVACAGLQQALAKKGAPAEEVLRSLRRVQRLEKGAPNSAR